jgi:hypothetical protein
MDDRLVRRVSDLSGGRNHPRSVSAVAPGRRDIHRVAEGVPYVPGIDVIIQGLSGGSAIQTGDHQFPGKRPGVFGAEDGIKKGVELP